MGGTEPIYRALIGLSVLITGVWGLRVIRQGDNCSQEVSTFPSSGESLPTMTSVLVIHTCVHLIVLFFQSDSNRPIFPIKLGD